MKMQGHRLAAAALEPASFLRHCNSSSPIFQILRTQLPESKRAEFVSALCTCLPGRWLSHQSCFRDVHGSTAGSAGCWVSWQTPGLVLESSVAQPPPGRRAPQRVCFWWRMPGVGCPGRQEPVGVWAPAGRAARPEAVARMDPPHQHGHGAGGPFGTV